jgi:hypothetical protein
MIEISPHILDTKDRLTLYPELLYSDLRFQITLKFQK